MVEIPAFINVNTLLKNTSSPSFLNGRFKKEPKNITIDIAPQANEKKKELEDRSAVFVA